jgi:hypothetical protein
MKIRVIKGETAIRVIDVSNNINIKIYCITGQIYWLKNLISC